MFANTKQQLQRRDRGLWGNGAGGGTQKKNTILQRAMQNIRTWKAWECINRKPWRDLRCYPCCSKTFFRKATTVVKLALTPHHRTNAIRRLNNIIVARLTNQRPSIISNKWRHDTSLSWQVLAEDFDKHKTEPIPDNVLVNLEMHISSLGYLEDGAPRFTEQLSMQAQKFLERTRLHILKAVWCDFGHSWHAAETIAFYSKKSKVWKPRSYWFRNGSLFASELKFSSGKKAALTASQVVNNKG